LANLSLLLFFKDLSIVRFYDFKKNFQGMCFTVQLSKIVLHCRLSQTALLLYHVASCLSRSFFNFF
jgi:catabolite regulation protein CreA